MSRDPLWITHPLLTVLLELAADADPRSVNVLLLASPAGDLEPLPDAALESPGRDPGRPQKRPAREPTALADLAPETPVYTDFYFPDVGNAVRNVFGVDLGTPPGQADGRFLSHPDGDPEMSVRDDLHAVVLVAIPPWEPGNVSAYDRHSRPRDLRIVAAGTAQDDFEG